MLIEKEAQYYLKRTRAYAKEIEFDIPEELRSRKDDGVDELFPVAIACIADLAADIVRGKENDDQIRAHGKELYFASKFYDSYLQLNVSEKTADYNYFNLIGAIAYYLCDQIGSSMVLIRHIHPETLELSSRGLDVLLYHLLSNSPKIEGLQALYNENEYILEFVQQYNKLMTCGISIDRSFIKAFRESIYSTNDYHDIFFIDALLAVFILKINHSIFKMLPNGSNISLDQLIEIINKDYFVRELWPAQRYMCEMGLFKGRSGVVQMPTGAGKTKAMSIAIYSAFCSDRIAVSIVIAPFRALCREISNDLKHDLKFDANIQISEVSDLIQTDYILEDLFDPERKTVVVTTPEKFLYIIRQNESIVDNIGQLIFDEGHLFDDEERGATYELLIASILRKVNSGVQRILISAIIPNVTEINNWFTKGKGIAIRGNDILGVDKLPAALGWKNVGGINYGYLYFISKDDYNLVDFYVPRMIEIKSLKLRRREQPRYFPSVNFKQGKMIESHDMAIACLLKIVSKDNVAIFCGRKDSANKILSRIIELKQRGYDISGLKRRCDSKEIVKISNLLKNNYGSDNDLYKAAQLGVFVHHAGVSDGVKSAVEYALKKSKITNVVCTSTLAQGVNLPIKYLVVSCIYQAGELIKVRDFHNLIGRTARSGMFTEGTVIFSDSFAYTSGNWRWELYKKLLDSNNSEPCTSVILDIVKTHLIDNESSCCFYKIALLRYTDFDHFQRIQSRFLSDSSENRVRLFTHVISVLSKIENYISLAVANNGNSYTDSFVDELLKDTLAESMATDSEKANLKTLFEEICKYISDIFPTSDSKRNFARSMISCETYLKLQDDIYSADVGNLSDDALLDFVMRVIIKYSSSRNLHKIIKVEDAIEISKMWMKGKSYYEIQTTANLYGYKIVRNKKESVLSIEKIATICDGDFGYSASIIINSIIEILKSSNAFKGEDAGNNLSETIEKLQKISQKLKYGLTEQSEIFVYELGFNDRFLAQAICKIIGYDMQKNDVKAAIKRNKERIDSLLCDYPSVYHDRLINL